MLLSQAEFASLGPFVTVWRIFLNVCDWEGSIGVWWVEARDAIKRAVCSAQPLQQGIAWLGMSAVLGLSSAAWGKSQELLRCQGPGVELAQCCPVSSS